MDLSESDFDGSDLGNFTLIGKRVLKRLLRQVRRSLLCLTKMTHVILKCT